MKFHEWNKTDIASTSHFSQISKSYEFVDRYNEIAGTKSDEPLSVSSDSRRSTPSPLPQYHKHHSSSTLTETDIIEETLSPSKKMKCMNEAIDVQIERK